MDSKTIDKVGLVALADRVEALVDESQLVRLLEPVAGLLWKDAYSGWVRFLELANVKAWESAAMTLVPSGVNRWHLRGIGRNDYPADIYAATIVTERGETRDADAVTPALALTAAALRYIAAGRP